MTRPNDVGGSDGFGPVEARPVEGGPDDAVFAAPWERQVFGLAMGFTAAVVPQSSLAGVGSAPLEVQGVGSVDEAVKALLGP